ncbi:hypothetical protein MKW94_002560 [Papaver nudicaule]|uniref:Uncharacterized protein n=1 Tax=Papaver nudicaule TaxID=74823 RepID=A0AA41VWN3_PAPNU|nr:hypothetical protein [Papaver nudicaule]
MSNITASKMVVALALCLFLLGGCFVEATEKNDDVCHWIGECKNYGDCNATCTSHGYARAKCKNKIFPSSKTNAAVIHATVRDPGYCCCMP